MAPLCIGFSVAIPALYGDRMDVPRRLSTGGIPRPSTWRATKSSYEFADGAAGVRLGRLELCANVAGQGRHVLHSRSLVLQHCFPVLRNTTCYSQEQCCGTPAASCVHRLSADCICADGDWQDMMP